MVPKMAPKWLQNGSKMAPWRAPRAPKSRGRFLSDFWCHFGPPFGAPNRAWNAPRATRRPILSSWRVPGRVPEGLWEVILGTFLRFGWRERKKGTKSANKHSFLKLFCMRFLTASVCILFASALAGAKAQLKKLLKTIGFCGGICVCAICARSATILQTERTSNKITVNDHTKSTLPRKRNKTSNK